MMGLLLDTDILVDVSRQRLPAVAFVTSLSEPFSISVLTVTELLSGVKTKAEETQFQSMIMAVACHVVTAGIAERAGQFRRKFGPSHGVGTVDCLIAATAVELNLQLASKNAKHFPMLDNLLVPYVL